MTMTDTALPASSHNGVMDDHDQQPNPGARARRRTFTGPYKLDVLVEYDAADRDGKGALLRREGLYTSHISEWRKQRDRGAVNGGSTRLRKSPEQVEVEKLRRRNESLETELKKTKLALEITRRARAPLELLSESADDEPKRPR
jgi:transposase